MQSRRKISEFTTKNNDRIFKAIIKTNLSFFKTLINKIAYVETDEKYLEVKLKKNTTLIYSFVTQRSCN